VQGTLAARPVAQVVAMTDPQVEGAGQASASWPDDALMTRIAQGDSGAFAVLVDRYLAQACSFIQRMTGLAEESEDVVQEAFLKVWQHAGTWDPGKGGVKTWFYRVLYNTAVDRMRRRLPATGDELTEMPDIAANPEEVAQANHNGRRVKAAVDALPERQRAAVVLSYYEGLSNREAAEALGVSIKALESLLVRARRTLAQELAPLSSMGD
jgi:RNA polymerase sigma-70 factor (ECF subfamily)